MTEYESWVAEHERLRPIRIELNAKLLKQIGRKAFEKADASLAS